MEKVSIIVPVYRVERYLRRTVESLLGQTHKAMEVILVDDGSPDGSGALCDVLAGEDGRVTVLHQENAGVSAARNAGIEAATGDWVGFCDGDDWFAPDFVEKLLACAQKEQADFVVCDYQIVADDRPPVVSGSVAMLESGCDKALAVALGPISSCTHLVRKSLFDRGVRYPVGVRQYEELPVMPVLASLAARIGVVDAPLYNYYQRGDGTSASNRSDGVAESFTVAYGQMVAALGEEYHREAEYHAIYALLYGEVLRLCKAGASAKEIKHTIGAFEKQYPDYRENPYIAHMGRAKTLFLGLCRLRFVTALRLLSWVHGKLVG